MINLLPPQLKEDYGYARRNSALRHILMSFAVGFAGLIVIAVAGVLYLHQSANSYAHQAIQIEESFKEQKQTEVEKQVQEISGSLKLAVQVLSQEVLFSQLLKQLAIVTPSAQPKEKQLDQCVGECPRFKHLPHLDLFEAKELLV